MLLITRGDRTTYHDVAVDSGATATSVTVRRIVYALRRNVNTIPIGYRLQKCFPDATYSLVVG